MENDTIVITITYNSSTMTGDINVSYDDDYIAEVTPENVAAILESAVADIREQLEENAE